MKNLVGRDMCASIKIADFKKEFMLEPLLHASAIVVDENDVGKYVDEAANFKAIITGDTITINRKHRIPITFQPHMLQVQCINELPQFKDKSESLYRRQLIIEFKKSFTNVNILSTITSTGPKCWNIYYIVCYIWIIQKSKKHPA